MGPSQHTSRGKNHGEEPLSAEVVSAHLKLMAPVYQRIAAASGFGIEFGDVTCFDQERNAVIIGLEQLKALGVRSLKLLDFIVLHEIGHFCEFHTDPVGYLAVVDEAKRRGGVEGKLYFDLNNALQDIYVNQNTADKAPEYRDGDGFTYEIRTLYRDHAFKQRNFTDRPRCVEFAHYLLNLGMGTADDITLSSEVQGEIQKGVSVFGNTYTYDDLIDTFLLPALGHRSPLGWTGSMTQRGVIIELALVPVFDRLLQMDKQEGREIANHSINPLADIDADLDAVEKAVHTAHSKESAKNLSPENKAKLERERQAAEIAERAGLNETNAQAFSDTLNRMQPVINDLVELLSKVQTKSSVWHTELQGPFSRGTEISLDAVIDRFEQVQRQPEISQVFMRDAPVEEVAYFPKTRRVWIVADLSNSMEDKESELRDITVALGAATVTVCQEQLIHSQTLSAELGMVGFHGSVIPLIDPTPSATLATVAAVFPRIIADGNETRDHLALADTKNRIQRLRSATLPGEVLDIIIEITDGETTDPEQSKAIQRSLKEMGVIVGAIHIGLPEQQVGESQPQAVESTFDSVWNSDGERRGMYVEHPSMLVPAVQQILEQAFEEHSVRDVV